MINMSDKRATAKHRALIRVRMSAYICMYGLLRPTRAVALLSLIRIVYCTRYHRDGAVCEFLYGVHQAPCRSTTRLSRVRGCGFGSTYVQRREYGEGMLIGCEGWPVG